MLELAGVDVEAEMVDETAEDVSEAELVSLDVVEVGWSTLVQMPEESVLPAGPAQSSSSRPLTSRRGLPRC